MATTNSIESFSKFEFCSLRQSNALDFPQYVSHINWIEYHCWYVSQGRCAHLLISTLNYPFNNRATHRTYYYEEPFIIFS